MNTLHEQNKLSDYAHDYLCKYVAEKGGQRAVAKILGVSNTLVWRWLHQQIKPSFRHLKKLSTLKEGGLALEVFLLEDKDLISSPPLLRQYIFSHFLNAKAKIVNISTDEYYNNFVPYYIRKIIENNFLCEDDLKYLHAFFGGTNMYWRSVMMLYPIRDRAGNRIGRKNIEL